MQTGPRSVRARYGDGEQADAVAGPGGSISFPTLVTRISWEPGAAGLRPLLLALCLPVVACAAADGEPRDRELVRQDWERHRDNVLAYVEAMPEEHFGFRPTPAVRTFAEQIEHIVLDHVDITATAFGREERPDLGDPGRYLHEKEALLAHVEAGYAFVLEVLADASDEELRSEGEVFGRYRVPRWKALAGALEHGTWTLGQTVPYLRLNGVEPPAYAVFPDPGDA